MTNMDYIISQLDERTLASLFLLHGDQTIKNKVTHAFWKWADSFSKNKGNCGYNTKTGESYENTDMMPSIWRTEFIFKEPAKRVRYGRTLNVSFQVWLISKYNERGEWDA